MTDRPLLRIVLATVLLIAAFVLVADTDKPPLILIIAPILTFSAMALIVDESILRVDHAIRRLGVLHRDPDWHRHPDVHHGHTHPDGASPHHHEIVRDI